MNNVVILKNGVDGSAPRSGRSLAGAIREISLKLCGKDVTTIDRDGKKHFVVSIGIPPNQVIKEDCPHYTGEFVVVEIEVTSTGRPKRVVMRRSISTSFELYFCKTDDGALVISNRFDVVLCALPPEQRSISEDALIDHLLSRTVLGRDTYCDRIERVVHGGTVSIDLENGAVNFAQAQRLPDVVAPASLRTYVNRIDHALANISTQSRSRTILFSGGVDSSLLATYQPDSDLLHCRISSPEFDRETQYARASAKILEMPLMERTLDEHGYLEALETTIDRVGTPPHHAMTALLTAGFEGHNKDIAIGADADTLFGFGNPYLLALGTATRGGVAHMTVSALLGAAPERLSRRLSRILHLAEALSLPIEDPNSFALGLKTPENAAIARQIFGSNKVSSRLHARFLYFRQLGAAVDGGARDPIDHIYVRHIIGYFMNNSVTVWRNLAASYGVSLSCPFTDARMLFAAQSIPAKDRFQRNFNSKHLLKQLLKRRLGGYPFRQKKLGGVLPLQRFFETGPLRDFANTYGWPDFMDGLALDALGASRFQFMWHAASYTIWRRRAVEWPQGDPPAMKHFDEAIASYVATV